MPARKHIGLEIGDTEFRLAELRADDDGPVLSYAAVQQTEYNYGSQLLHEAPYNRKVAKAFIRDLTTLFYGSGLEAPRISVAIPASSVLIATIPVDARLEPQQKREHLQWESRMLYGFEEDVDVDVRTFLLGATAEAERHLAAAIPQQTLAFLKSVFAQLAFTVSAIDIDHFVIESHLAQHIPNTDGITYAVFGLNEESCTVGVYDRGRYCGFRQNAVSFHEGYFAQALRMLQSVLEDEPGVKLEAVFAFGSATTQPLLDSLRSLLSIPVRKYDPKKGMPFLGSQPAETVSAYAPHVFDVPVSAAALGLQ